MFELLTFVVCFVVVFLALTVLTGGALNELDMFDMLNVLVTVLDPFSLS